jgi:outer membrane protein assembly factor BamB
MKRKIIGILVCMLLMTTIGFSNATDWWPMFGHDTSHSRYSTSTTPDTGGILWNYTTGNYIQSSPAVANVKVYIGSNDNKVYCLDAATGGLVWSYPTSDVVTSSPAVNNGKVYIGSCDHKVYCFNESTGLLSWSYTTGGDVTSSPAVANLKVYIGSWDHKVYCLDKSTGDLDWSFTTGDIVSSSPAVAYGWLYIGSWDKKVYCLDTMYTGMLWSYTTGGYVISSPAVADEKVYIGSYDHKVYCLNATTGGLIWSYTTGDTVSSSPAVANGKVYIGSDDYKVYCLDAMTGAKVWSYTTGGFVGSSPAVADGKVYVGSGDGKVYCLDTGTGGLVWSYQTGDYVGSSPAVADEKVYIGSYDHKMYCFGSSNQPPNTPSTPSGPSSGYTGTNYIYSTSSNDPEGNDVYYWFDWNDGTNNGWVGPYASGATGSASHSWSSPGTYAVKAKSKDTYGAESGWSAAKTVVITQSVNHPPNKPQKPTGPTTRVTGQSGKYWANGTDPDGDKIQYRFDWNASGSHQHSAWTSLVNSGTKLSKNHTWTTPGTYVVKVQSRDEHGAVSTWSNGLTVTVTINHPPNKPQKPTGPTTRLVGQQGTYWANDMDPDGDKIQYRFDWDAAGAHQYSSWTSLVNSGTKLSKNHAWTSPGTYAVKVQSRDEHGAKSVWSNGLTVIVHT